MPIKNLEFFFNPRSIAVIGASEDPKSLGYSIFENLIGKGFRGTVYPVTPKAEAVQGVEAYGMIGAIQRDIDLAVLAVPPGEILDTLNQCGQKGVKGVIILCLDFKSRAENPQLLSSKILQASSEYGFRVLGPDSLGFIKPSLKLNASIFPKMPPEGNIAFISQSATLSSALLDRAVSKHVGFSHFVSLGSKLDIDFADMIDFLGVDPRTWAIILYIESITVGRKFMTAVRSFASSKPIVVIKSGKFEASAHIALTYSGFLAGEDKVYDAALKRAGAIRVEEMLDLFYLAETLAKQQRPKGKRLAIVSNSGGPSVIATDALLKLDGELGQLGKETLAFFKEKLPFTRTVQNPVDLLYDASSQDYGVAVKGCLEDNDIDGVLVIHTPFCTPNTKEIAESVASVSKAYTYKPLLTVWMGDDRVIQAREFFIDKGIPTFVTPEQAVRSFISMYRYDYNLKLLSETPEAILKDFEPDEKRVKEIITRASMERRLVLNLNEVKEILQAYGIPVVPTRSVQGEDEAVTIAGEVGYPVVLKIDSPKIFHKLEKGGVVLNLRDEESVKEAFKNLKQIAISIGDPEAHMLIQPMVLNQGFELVIGAKKDPTFGAVIVFGTGGRLVEAIGDYSVGLPPLNQILSLRMMSETKIHQYLQQQPAFKHTLKYLEEVLVRFSSLIVDFPHIKEIDINPFFVTEKEGFALDAGILLEAEGFEGYATFKGEFCPPHLCICPYPVQYVDKFKLPDDTTVVIRPIRPEDEPLIDELFTTASEHTITMRFFQRLTYISHERLVRYCQIDYDRELAFVAVIEEDQRERIIGDVRFSRQPDLENAEMAVLVSDQWQGHGIGKKLCEYCIGIAKEYGLKKIYMEILRDNTRMLHRAKQLGFTRVHIDQESERVVLTL